MELLIKVSKPIYFYIVKYQYVYTPLKMLEKENKKKKIRMNETKCFKPKTL